MYIPTCDLIFAFYVVQSGQNAETNKSAEFFRELVNYALRLNLLFSTIVAFAFHHQELYTKKIRSQKILLLCQIYAIKIWSSELAHLFRFHLSGVRTFVFKGSPHLSEKLSIQVLTSILTRDMYSNMHSTWKWHKKN